MNEDRAVQAAMPKLYGAPAYARPPVAAVNPVDRPFDPDDLPIEASNPIAGDPKRFIDPLPQFRQFCCPGCGLAIENEIAVAEDPVLRDVEILFR